MPVPVQSYPVQNALDTIAFDDAGIGNILGGVVIGAMHAGGFRSRIIEPEWFEFGTAFRSIVSSHVLQILLEASSDAPVPIRRVVLCRGDIFDGPERDLRRLGYSTERRSIDGELQDRTERTFYHHLIDLGLPDHILRMMPGCRDGGAKDDCYRRLNEYSVSFLLSCPEKRMGWAKANCATTRKLKGEPVERELCPRLPGRPKRCVECGRNVRTDAWRCAAAGRIFYVHERCAKWA